MLSITDLQPNKNYIVDGIGVMAFVKVVNINAQILEMRTKDFTYYAELKQIQSIK